MFDNQETIISAEQSPVNNDNISHPQNVPRKRFIISVIVIIVLAGLVIGTAFFIKNLIKNRQGNNSNPVVVVDKPVDLGTSTLPNFPIFEPTISKTSTSTIINLSDTAIEYMSFEDFYTAPEKLEPVKGFFDYELPLNIKMDVANYYALSRKLNLDLVIDDLNENGFAVIDNPWNKEADNFYDIYSNLGNRQIPILISSDFLIYYYQNTIKKAYKEIEENIFYDNLWNINKELYLTAKARYEARLALVGGINDSVLEAARLQTAFFATALELLKPDSEQISLTSIGETGKFLSSEAGNFHFLTPIYLQDEVTKELALIKTAKENTKSPVLLYTRDYKKFIVPMEYKQSARLNNLYLTMKWLNSVFPLNYQDKACPNCLLDKADWRLTTIAASFISADFSNSPELKNRWARIYKIMSFFHPLKDDLNYVFYRDTLKTVFGEKAKPALLFDDKNIEAQDNLQKLRVALNKIEFSPFLGAIDKQDTTNNYLQGFKVLSHDYSPSEYIFNNLTYPQIGVYQGENAKSPNNLTACNLKSISQRCNGFSLDLVNLIYKIDNNDYFTENSNYDNYQSKSEALSLELDTKLAWHINSYWSNLAYLSAYLNADKDNLPLYASSSRWRDKQIDTTVAAWVNEQLPFEKFSFNQSNITGGLASLAQYLDDSYIEPNLDLIDELLANSSMIKEMLTALQIDRETPAVIRSIKDLETDLRALREIVLKELSGQTLDNNDNETIVNFAKKLKIEATDSPKRVIVKSSNLKKDLKVELSNLKLLVLIRQEKEGKIISVGPVWDYIESR